jgi:flagellar hook protein FlgE
MIESIFIAMTGLRGYEQGLRVISNNTANLNTPGFKNSDLQFADLFYATDILGGSATPSFGQYGYGLDTRGTTINFVQGELANTGNPLDVAVDGLGFFVVRDTAGDTHYTRDGQFSFNSDGILVTKATGEQVLGYSSSGALGPISIADLGSSAARATSTVTFSGNLSSTATTYTLGAVTVIDPTGTSHTLSVKFDRVAGTLGAWDVTVLDGTTTVTTGRIAFLNGQPDPAQSTISFDYAFGGQSPMPLKLDFSAVTSYDSGTRSTLKTGAQSGYSAGTLVGTDFDTDGYLLLTYSNGQTAKGPRLALANFTSPDAVASIGANEYAVRDGLTWTLGKPGANGLGVIRSREIETSNVNLSQEFSDLVIMQRGYQASSQVISTANEMLAELFGMRGSR